MPAERHDTNPHGFYSHTLETAEEQVSENPRVLDDPKTPQRARDCLILPHIPKKEIHSTASDLTQSKACRALFP